MLLRNTQGKLKRDKGNTSYYNKKHYNSEEILIMSHRKRHMYVKMMRDLQYVNRRELEEKE